MVLPDLSMAMWISRRPLGADTYDVASCCATYADIGEHEVGIPELYRLQLPAPPIETTCPDSGSSPHSA
jgi:hypothetical protein